MKEGGISSKKGNMASKRGDIAIKKKSTYICSLKILFSNISIASLYYNYITHKNRYIYIINLTIK